MSLERRLADLEQQLRLLQAGTVRHAKVPRGTGANAGFPPGTGGCPCGPGVRGDLSGANADCCETHREWTVRLPSALAELFGVAEVTLTWVEGFTWQAALTLDCPYGSDEYTLTGTFPKVGAKLVLESTEGYPTCDVVYAEWRACCDWHCQRNNALELSVYRGWVMGAECKVCVKPVSGTELGDPQPAGDVSGCMSPLFPAGATLPAGLQVTAAGFDGAWCEASPNDIRIDRYSGTLNCATIVYDIEVDINQTAVLAAGGLGTGVECSGGAFQHFESPLRSVGTVTAQATGVVSPVLRRIKASFLCSATNLKVCVIVPRGVGLDCNPGGGGVGPAYNVYEDVLVDAHLLTPEERLCWLVGPHTCLLGGPTTSSVPCTGAAWTPEPAVGSRPSTITVNPIMGGSGACPPALDAAPAVEPPTSSGDCGAGEGGGDGGGGGEFETAGCEAMTTISWTAASGTWGGGACPAPVAPCTLGLCGAQHPGRNGDYDGETIEVPCVCCGATTGGGLCV